MGSRGVVGGEGEVKGRGSGWVDEWLAFGGSDNGRCNGGVYRQQPQIATHSVSNRISTTGCSLNKWQFDKTTHPPVIFGPPPTLHSPRTRL